VCRLGVRLAGAANDSSINQGQLPAPGTWRWTIDWRPLLLVVSNSHLHFFPNNKNKPNGRFSRVNLFSTCVSRERRCETDDVTRRLRLLGLLFSSVFYFCARRRFGLFSTTINVLLFVCMLFIHTHIMPLKHTLHQGPKIAENKSGNRLFQLFWNGLWFASMLTISFRSIIDCCLFGGNYENVNLRLSIFGGFHWATSNLGFQCWI
jgi:hypothetical protein